jgi:hypothetical protein
MTMCPSAPTQPPPTPRPGRPGTCTRTQRRCGPPAAAAATTKVKARKQRWQRAKPKRKGADQQPIRLLPGLARAGPLRHARQSLFESDVARQRQGRAAGDQKRKRRR